MISNDGNAFPIEALSWLALDNHLVFRLKLVLIPYSSHNKYYQKCNGKDSYKSKIPTNHGITKARDFNDKTTSKVLVLTLANQAPTFRAFFTANRPSRDFGNSSFDFEVLKVMWYKREF